MKSGSLVVRHHSPVQRWGIRIGGAILVVAVSWGLYVYGKMTAGYDQIEASDVEQRLLTTIESLKNERVTLRDQIALLERSNQMDKQAYVEVDSSLKALQEEILELREQVSFYRGIVAPRESSAGLRIERLEMSGPADDRLYHYELVLTQVLKNQRTVRGNAYIEVEGLENGRPRTLKFRNITVSGKKDLDFRFRYFQKFDGDVVLPEGFVPRSVNVSVKASRHKKEIKSSFDWASLVGGKQEAVASSTSSIPQESAE
jgi:uncharacterized protein YdcH (DUF465 family)